MSGDSIFESELARLSSQSTHSRREHNRDDQGERDD